MLDIFKYLLNLFAGDTVFSFVANSVL